jgi:hypothetical protein
MTIDHPILLLLATILWTALVAITKFRNPAIPRASKLSLFFGAALLALSAGGIRIDSSNFQNIVVLIDESSSTRTAAYHNQAFLQKRLSQLLGSTNYTLATFSSPAATQTDYSHPDADAVLLFSDVRFPLPEKNPPTFVIVDPNLEKPADASIVSLTTESDRAVAIVRNSGTDRAIDFSGTLNHPSTAPSGDVILSVRVDPTASQIAARLAPGDPWPENDSLSLARLSSRRQRWWIDENPPTSDWIVIEPNNLPNNLPAYLDASLIALSNVPVSQIAPIQRDRLSSFVRDLGGGLMILGGDRAFAAGEYGGSTLDQLSPLASHPNQPQRHWILLVDSSGSMASPSEPGGSRFAQAANLLVQLLPTLPPEDRVTIGDFARDVRWWSQNTSARESRNLNLPPQSVSPQGPTNFEAALNSLASQLAGGQRSEIILITDGDAQITEVDSLATKLRNAAARVHLLLTGATASPTASRLAILTAGSLAREPNASNWADAARKLVAANVPDRVERSATPVDYSESLGVLPNRMVNLWNQTFLKRDATLLAATSADIGRLPLVARWNAGLGAVLSAGFSPTPAELESFAALVTRKPVDPRFEITLIPASPLRVTIRAFDDQKPLNKLKFSLVLTNETDPTRGVARASLKQIAPGEYSATVPAKSDPSLATVLLNELAIEHFSVAGRYAVEFDLIGNDNAAMKQLADSSNGAVIDPRQANLALPRRDPTSISPLLSAAAACSFLISLGFLKFFRRE